MFGGEEDLPKGCVWCDVTEIGRQQTKRQSAVSSGAVLFIFFLPICVDGRRAEAQGQRKIADEQKSIWTQKERSSLRPDFFFCLLFFLSLRWGEGEEKNVFAPTAVRPKR